MKKVISFLLVLAMALSLCACGLADNNEETVPTAVVTNDSIQVNTSIFSPLQCKKDEFTGTTFYYPNSSKGKIVELEFSKFGSTDTTFSLQIEDSFSAFPVIRYNKSNEIPYQFECVLRCGYVEGGNVHSALSFDEAIIVTDNHRYTISNIVETNRLGVYDSANIVVLGENGIEMIKDICSCDTVKIRMTEWTGDSTDIEIDSSVFDIVLDAVKLYESAGCGQYDFGTCETNIVIEE